MSQCLLCLSSVLSADQDTHSVRLSCGHGSARREVCVVTEKLKTETIWFELTLGLQQQQQEEEEEKKKRRRRGGGQVSVLFLSALTPLF